MTIESYLEGRERERKIGIRMLRARNWKNINQSYGCRNSNNHQVNNNEITHDTQSIDRSISFYFTFELSSTIQ